MVEQMLAVYAVLGLLLSASVKGGKNTVVHKMIVVLKILKYIKGKKYNLDFEFQELHKLGSYGKQKFLTAQKFFNNFSLIAKIIGVCNEIIENLGNFANTQKETKVTHTSTTQRHHY